jgi:hypothetical protein
MDLDSINLRRQRIFLNPSPVWKPQATRNPNTLAPFRGPFPLHTIYDAAPVRVAAFILEYSDPYYQGDEELVRKYLAAWRREFNGIPWTSLARRV